jgi:branched-chain amino acid transport system permease protein
MSAVIGQQGVPVERGSAGRSGRIALLGVLVAAAIVLPFLLPNYRVFQATTVLIYAIALLGLNILTGYNGQISIGHGAFYAIGAYATAILMDHYNAPLWVCLPLSGLVCLVAGFLFGLPALRLEGVYLALATFALGVSLPQLLKYKGIEAWTGGVQGITLIKPAAPVPRFLGLELNADRWLYFITLAVTIVMFVIGWNLLRGRVGRALVAIRDQPIAASTMGIDNSMYKSLAFGVSSMFTGIAGSLGAVAVGFVGPDSFTIFLSISLVVGMVVGGLASISGAFWGALFIQFVPNFADNISKAAPWAIYGALMIAFMYVMPVGIAGALHLAWRRIRGTKPGSTAA